MGIDSVQDYCEIARKRIDMCKNDRQRIYEKMLCELKPIKNRKRNDILKMIEVELRKND